MKQNNNNKNGTFGQLNLCESKDFFYDLRKYDLLSICLNVFLIKSTKAKLKLVQTSRK